MRHRPLRVAIDARYLSHDLVGGVNTYLRNLSLALLRIDTGQRYVYWIDGKAPFELEGLDAAFETRRLPWRNGLSSIRNDLRLGRAMAGDGADLAHFPANYGFAPAQLPTLVTLHDAINVLPLSEILRGHSRHLRTVATMTYLHLVTVRAMRRHPFVVTVSRYSRDEILKHVDLDPDRVFVVPSAHESVFRRLDRSEVEPVRRRYGLRERVLLADAIKNPDCVLRAYRALPSTVRDDTSLVFFSRRAVSDAVQRSHDAGESTVVLRPERDELVRLFNLADLLVFPSWYEGFGLPALEAMACGTPVIASTRGSLPEVVGDAGFLTDAEDHTAIARWITELLADGPALARWSSRALARASTFSWERSARLMSEIYQEVYERSQPSHQRLQVTVTST